MVRARRPTEDGTAGPRSRLGSARLGSARLGSARLGSARLGSARLYRGRQRRLSTPASRCRAPDGGLRCPAGQLTVRVRLFRSSCRLRSRRSTSPCASRTSRNYTSPIGKAENKTQRAFARFVLFPELTGWNARTPRATLCSRAIPPSSRPSRWDNAGNRTKSRIVPPRRLAQFPRHGEARPEGGQSASVEQPSDPSTEQCEGAEGFGDLRGAAATGAR